MLNQYNRLVLFKDSEGQVQLHKVLVTTIAVFPVCIIHLLHFTSFLGYIKV